METLNLAKVEAIVHDAIAKEKGQAVGLKPAEETGATRPPTAPPDLESTVILAAAMPYTTERVPKSKEGAVDDTRSSVEDGATVARENWRSFVVVRGDIATAKRGVSGGGTTPHRRVPPSIATPLPLLAVSPWNNIEETRAAKKCDGKVVKGADRVSVDVVDGNGGGGATKAVRGAVHGDAM
ncbi:hypothetical protein PIB30_043918 [Stylosanthes scabra]|uniref:Uncharacterized protein n=1 Tax=Stylosanthes scabra TaxID=79078 RepID=A0ABU6UED2_9FABA|nr:hypothetical protein [Stylosanthes scabra]